MENYRNSQEETIYVDPDEAIEFHIPKGANASDIAKALKKEGIISSVNLFKFLSKINGYDGKYKSGVHIISDSLSYDKLMRILTSTPANKLVTIPEGKTFLQIVDILYENNVIKDKEKFIEVANNEKFDYDFLNNLSDDRDYRLEGYLFPDTYKFDTDATEKEVIEMMLSNFKKKMNKTYLERIEQLEGMTLDKIIILASIIEREGKTSSDRDKIAGVFYNRLNNKDKNLRKLQSCATIQYILLKTTGNVKERLTDKDLQIKDPYNTYLHEGLPPGPICSPGEDAIKAALYPEKTDSLYFVAKGDGTHEFSSTYEEHQAAIAKYGLR